MGFLPNAGASAASAAAALAAANRALAGGVDSMTITGSSGTATVGSTIGYVYCREVEATTLITLSSPGEGRRILIFSLDYPGSGFSPLVLSTPTGTINGAGPTWVLDRQVMPGGYPQVWEVAGFLVAGVPQWHVHTPALYPTIQAMRSSVVMTSERNGGDYDRLILCDLTEACNYALPSPGTFLGDEIMIRDIGDPSTNGFATYNLSVITADGEAINGSLAPLVLTVNSSSTRFVTDGENWFTVGISVL